MDLRSGLLRSASKQATSLFSVIFFLPATGQVAARTGDDAVTFKAGVHLVMVPVVVRDPKGKAVGNLTRDDFQLFDKGKRQEITKFTVEKAGGQVANPAASGNAGSSRKDKQPATAPESSIAYLFDDVHLNFADLARVRDAAGRNIDALPPADRAAIFTTSGQGMADFTGDRAMLHAALLKLRPHPLPGFGAQGCPDVSYYVADLIRNKGDQQALEAVTAEAMDCMRLHPRAIGIARARAMDAARLVLSQGQHESRISLLLLRGAVRRISVMPGRRIIILASPGFLVPEDLREDELDVVDRATRSSVIISSLDARGLYTVNPAGGIEEENDSNEENGANEQAGLLAQYQQTDAVVRSGVLAEMAAGTAGTLIRNTNDFDSGFRRLATAPEYVYMLGFAPEDLKLDGSFHPLKVKLKSAGRLSLQARHGYFAQKDRESERPVAKEEIDSALSSREEVHELPMELHTEFSRPSDTEAKLQVQARVDLKEWLHRADDGRNRNDLTLVLALFDNAGNFVTGWQKTVQVLPPDETTGALQPPPAIKVTSSFDVRPGSYRIRLVVRDAEGHLMASENGAIRIP